MRRVDCFASVHLVLLAVHAASASISDATALAQRGIALAQNNQCMEAVQALESSLELDPSNVATLCNLGLVWEQAGLPLQAMETYGRALEIEPSSAAVYVRLASALETHMDEREMAVEAAEMAVELGPERADAWNLLGTLQHSRGSLEDAQDALERATTLQPDDASMRTNYATALRASGRFADSLRELRAAAALDDALARDPHLAFAPPLEAGDDGSSSSSSKDATAPPEWRVAAVAEEGALPERTPKEMREALRQVCITRVLEADECKWAIETAEAHVAANGGWDGEGHHDAHKTKDLVVAESPELSSWVRSKLTSHIWPAMSQQFGVPMDELWLEDCFVVKYEHDGQPGLGSHADDSELSFNLLLSEPGVSFTGGGTAFDLSGEGEEGEATPIRPERGEMLSHFGRIRHTGLPVTKGTRYIIAGFVRAKPFAEEWRRLRGEASSQAPSEGELEE